MAQTGMAQGETSPPRCLSPFPALARGLQEASGRIAWFVPVVLGALVGLSASAAAVVSAEGENYVQAEFRDPPAIFWPGYLWILNDEVNLEALLGQLKDMREHDARSVCLLVEPKEFRPDSLATRFDPPYLSDDYFKVIRAVVDRAGELGMNYWLYDEGGWPSGAAAGRVYRENPRDFGPKSLVLRTETLRAGHYGGEDVFEGNAVYGFGHLLRQLRRMDVPGTDVIWRQVYPGGPNRPFSKYAASVAHQKALPHVFCEMLCVYGNGVTPGEIRWLTDFQYARGTTLSVLGCYPQSTRDHFMAGERPHFGKVNPHWKYMPICHAYAARLGYLLSRGQPACGAALYYDVRSVWAGGEDRSRAVRQHDALADTLLESQCEFDFVVDDVLSGREGTVEGGRIVAGPMRYDTLIVPATRWMEKKSLENVAHFVQQGGTLLAIDALPSGDGGACGLLDRCGEDTPSDKRQFSVGKGTVRIVATGEVGRLCRPLVRATPQSKSLRVLKRFVGQGAIYFLVNEGDAPLAAKARFDEAVEPVVFDLVRAACYPMAATQTAESTTTRLDLPGRSSMVVGFGFTADSPAPPRAGQERLVLDQGWTLRPLERYSVGEHDYQIKAVADAAPKPVRLGDWKEHLGEWFSGDVEYAAAFDWNAESWGNRALLDLGEVRYACEVFLNGQSMGRSIWAPYQVELTALRPGRNELRVVVTNTLANALLDPQVRQSWAKKPGPGWTIGYDQQAAGFEKDSLPSGLLGPVRFLEAKP